MPKLPNTLPAWVAVKPRSRSSGTVLVTMPTMAETTSVSARFKVQNLRERTALRKSPPGGTSTLAGDTAAAAAAAAATALATNGPRSAPWLSRNQAQASGQVSSKGRASSTMKPARRSQRAMAQLSSGGRMAADRPEPHSTKARASPRRWSNHWLMSWVQVTKVTPVPAIGARKKAR